MTSWNKVAAVISIIIGVFLSLIGILGIAAVSNPEVSSTTTPSSYVMFCCFPALVFFVVGLALFLLPKHKQSTMDKLQRLHSLLPKSDGEEFIFRNVTLQEERAIREWVSGGPRFRITSGFWVALNKGRSESHGELRNIDTGAVTMNSDDIIFSGELKNITLQKKNINTFSINSPTRVVIGVTNRQKVLYFENVFSNLFACIFVRTSGEKIGDDVKEENGKELIDDITYILNLPDKIKGEGSPSKKRIEALLEENNLALEIAQKLSEYYQPVVKKTAIAEVKEMINHHKTYIKELGGI